MGCHWNCYRHLGKTGVYEGDTSAERPKVWKFVGEIPGPGRDVGRWAGKWGQIETLIDQIPVREAENGVDHEKMKTSVTSAGGGG